MPELSPLVWFHVFAALSGILVAEACFLLIARRVDARVDVNRRMRLGSRHGTKAETLVQLRKERGLGDGGEGRSSFLVSLARLRTQSGLVMPLARFVAICTAVGSGIGLLVAIESAALWAMAAGTAFGAAILPILVLRRMKKSRLKRFGVQLPEALDLIVRGLKAGHPVPVALAMVGQEMPDPIGSEFGIVADEMTYGSDLATALKGLAGRVGHEDLPLFVIAVSIQTSTGGNLREILDGLADTIRGRVKLRRKIRAISTEGRMSAYILTAVPLFLVGAVLLITPDYYSAVIGERLTHILIAAAVALLAIGNFAMFRMANFRF